MSSNVWNCIISHRTEQNSHKYAWLHFFGRTFYLFVSTKKYFLRFFVLTFFFVFFFFLLYFAHCTCMPEASLLSRLPIVILRESQSDTKNLMQQTIEWAGKKSCLSSIEKKEMRSYWIKVFQIIPVVNLFHWLWNYRKNSIEYAE